MANTQPEQHSALKERFVKFLRIHHIESRVVIAGRPIDLWDLWYAVSKSDISPERQTNDPLKFHLIGAQLGVPTNPQTGQIASQQAKYLQEDYDRVESALENARNLKPPPHSLPPYPSQNARLLQTLARTYPNVDFGTVTPDVIANLPCEEFEAKMKSYLSDMPRPGNANQVVDSPPNDNEVSVEPQIMSAFIVEEILSFHAECQSLWRQAYNAIPLTHPSYPFPNDTQRWNDRFKQAMLEMKPLVVGLGLHYHMKRKPEERIIIIQMSVLLMKQLELMDTRILVPIVGLELMVGYLQPLRLGFERRIDTLRSPGVLPLALYHLTNHADVDLATLGGLLPATNPSLPTQSPEGSETATPLAPVATPFDSSANTSDDDLDADGDYEMDELEDDEDSGSAGGDSEMGETTDEEFFAAAADASDSHQHRD